MFSRALVFNPGGQDTQVDHKLVSRGCQMCNRLCVMLPEPLA